MSASDSMSVDEVVGAARYWGVTGAGACPLHPATDQTAVNEYVNIDSGPARLGVV